MKQNAILRSLGFALMAALPLSAQESAATVTLFQNVRVFDGKSGELSAPTNLLVRGCKIEIG